MERDQGLHTGKRPETITELPPAEWIDCDSPQKSGYLCLQDEQYFYPDTLQVILTIQWLTSNYETADGISLPRCSIYKHYTEFCRKQSFKPVNAASFGKVIRQVFPELKTRRLGTRGQSKYHYDGIQVKKASPYFKELSTEQRESLPSTFQSLINFPGAWNAWQDVVPHESPMTKPAPPNIPEDKVSEYLLPDFPDAEEAHLGDNILVGKVDSFLETYRAHCQKLLNVVLNSKLDEVHFHMERFWHEMSGTSQQLLGIDKVALLIGVCDKLLYQTIMSMLMPGIVQHLLPSLLLAIRHFSCGFVKHLEEALVHQPSVLVTRKMEVAKDFANLLKRKTSLSHLAQAMCTVLRTEGSIKQMLHDWRKRTELTVVRSQLLWLVDDNEGPDWKTINKYLYEFACLLDKQITVEDHLKWLESVRKRCLSKYDDLPVEERAYHERRFMLQFCYISNLIIRDQTLRSATSFGSFHLLHLMYEEYLLYVLDVNKIQQHEKAMWMELHGKDAKVPENFMTTMGISSLDRFYGPVYKYQTYLASLQAKKNPKPGSTGSNNPNKDTPQPLYHSPAKVSAQPLYQTHSPAQMNAQSLYQTHSPAKVSGKPRYEPEIMDVNHQRQQMQMQQAWSGIHTNNSAQVVSFPVDLSTTFLHSSDSSTPAQTLTLSPQVVSALTAQAQSPTVPPGSTTPSGTVKSQVSAAATATSTPVRSKTTPSPGSFRSNEFAPIQYSPSPQPEPNSSRYTPPPPSSTVPSSAVPFSSPLVSAGMDSGQLPPLDLSPQVMKTVSFGAPMNNPVCEPINLSTSAATKPHTVSTAPVLSTTKFIATQVLKVSLVDKTAESTRSNITLSLPLAHGLNLSKGQILKLSDGKAYKVEEVHTVLKETTDDNIQNQAYGRPTSKETN